MELWMVAACCSWSALTWNGELQFLYCSYCERQWLAVDCLKRLKVISSFRKVQSALAIVENLSSIYVVPSYFSCGMFGGLSSMAEVRNLGTQAALRKAFWNAAAVNENRRHHVLPWYNQGLLTIRVRSRLFRRDHYLEGGSTKCFELVERAVHWHVSSQFSRSFPRFNLSAETGAGLLWNHGYFLGQVIAQLHLNLPQDAVHFLDVGAGTGFASLVALLRGWRVLSTDFSAESGRARRYSAMASFGNSSVLERFQTTELDLLDSKTWPKTNAHVICATHFSEEWRNRTSTFAPVSEFGGFSPGWWWCWTLLLSLVTKAELRNMWDMFCQSFWIGTAFSTLPSIAMAITPSLTNGFPLRYATFVPKIWIW